jgi:Xaa-Pro aminopeptidase
LVNLSASRAKRIFEQISKNSKIKKKPDVIILANAIEPHIDDSFFYVTGFPYGLFEGSILVARKNGEVSLLTSLLEESIARAHGKGIDIFAEKDPKKNRERLKSIVGKRDRLVGVNSAELTVKSLELIKSVLKGAEIVDVGDAISRARLIKDQKEIESIQKACEIASRAYKRIPDILKDGISESQVAAEMAYEMDKLGGNGVSFESIVAFGKNSALPHYSAGSAKLRKGDFILTDYGTKFNRYCSDITRTMTYGPASKQQKRMYEIVKEANEVGIENCTPSHTGEEVHSRVSRVIDSTEYHGRFIHGTGHSLGLAVHDGVGLSKTNKEHLEPGMVLTVEPGIYVPSLGGVRIEDDVMVTKNKPRILTSATRALIEA